MGRVTLSFGNTKQAALYFDSVIPMGLVVDLVAEHGRAGLGVLEGSEGDHWNELLITRSRLLEICPDMTKLGSSVMDDWAELNLSLLRIAAELWKDIPDLGDHPSTHFNVANQVSPRIHRLNSKYNKRLGKFLINIGAQDAVVAAADGLVQESTEHDSGVMLKIGGLNLIDAEAVSLEKLIEFRRDSVAMEKLRNLRLFALKEYTGKTVSYIEDDLYSKIADYDAQVKKWEFDTRSGAFSMLLNSKFLAGGTAISLVGALMNNPTIAVGSLAAGTIAEFGNVALEVSRMKFQASDALRRNPVSYLVDARKALVPDA